MVHECFIYDGLLVDLTDCILAPFLVGDVLDNDGASVYNMRVHEETIISWNNDGSVHVQSCFVLTSLCCKWNANLCVAFEVSQIRLVLMMMLQE